MKLLVLTIALSAPQFSPLRPKGSTIASRRYGIRTERRGYSRRSELPREDDVFFCPGVDLLTMRASQLVILERRVRVEIFVDR